MVNMVLSLKDRLIYNIKDNKMKLRQQQITKVEEILSDLERKVEEMEQQDYITFDLGKDLQNILFRIDMLREELKKK
tara:strand:+ start:441 stop:671 length:231 start_codon:yes stop_codon:yes gene_type:complete